MPETCQVRGCCERVSDLIYLYITYNQKYMHNVIYILQ